MIMTNYPPAPSSEQAKIAAELSLMIGDILGMPK